MGYRRRANDFAALQKSIIKYFALYIVHKYKFSLVEYIQGCYVVF